MRFRLRTLMILAALGAVLLAGWCVPRLFPPSLENAAHHARTVVLHEGLPHQMYEVDLLAKERRTKAVQELNGYSFYQETLDLDDGDAKLLAEVLSDRATLKPFKIEKPCGGFHPDYATEFRWGFARVRVLICFGCEEVKIFGSSADARYDLSPEASQKLSDILKAYRKNRPFRPATI